MLFLSSVGYVPQQPDALLFADTVQAEIDFTRRTHGLPPDGAQLIQSLGLTPYRLADPRDLSVGERQRVALAAVLAGDPPLLILDEPTGGWTICKRRCWQAYLREPARQRARRSCSPPTMWSLPRILPTA